MATQISRTFTILLCIVCTICLSHSVAQEDISGSNQLNQIDSDSQLNLQKNIPDKNKCEIEISTRGTCIVNNNRLKPQILLSFQRRPQPAPFQQLTTISPDYSRPDDDKFKIVNENGDFKKKVVHEFVASFINLMKQEYGQYLEPLVIKELQFMKLKHLGNADIYNLKIYGIKGIEPIESKLESSNGLSSSKWKFNVKLGVSNLTVTFNVDANLKEKLFVKNWKLTMLIEKCLFQAHFLIDFDLQVLMIASLYIKSFENFKLISETLSWPFNEIVSKIVNKEKYYLKHIIELNVQKYINMTLNNNFDLNDIINKILKNGN